MRHFLVIAITLLAAACGRPADKGHHHDDDDSSALTANRALYDEAREIHDEVMPKIEDIYNLKKNLRSKIADTPDLADQKKKEIENAISKLDSASNAMMDWMHGFRPLPDSADQEKAREYLETEIERIKKVRDMMNESLQEARLLAGSK
jgi:hypothetical protein